MYIEEKGLCKSTREIRDSYSNFAFEAMKLFFIFYFKVFPSRKILVMFVCINTIDTF